MAEWGYILNGTGRISAIDDSGRSYTADIKGSEGYGPGHLLVSPSLYI